MSQLGMSGEWTFAALCTSPQAKYKANVNRPTNDQHGWDYFIEISPENKNTTADNEIQVVQCLAQIKTSRQKSKVVRLKLSNALKAAQTPFPMFIFLLLYQNDTTSPKIFGRHVWQHEITNWLRNARERSASGNVRLNKIEIPVQFNASDEIFQPPSDWMYEQVLTHGGLSYTEAKIQLVKTVGYDGNSYMGTLSIGPIASAKEIALHEVGILPDLPVTKMEVFDLRFGIRSPQPVFSTEEGGRISMTREPQKAELLFEACTSQRFSCPANVWLSTLLGPDHPETRMRVDAGCVDFVVEINKSQQAINFSFHFERSAPLSQILACLNFICWTKDGHVKISIQNDMGELIHGFVREPVKIEDWMPYYQRALKHAHTVFDKGKLEKVETSVMEIKDLCTALDMSSQLAESRHFRFSAHFDKDLEKFSTLAMYTYGQVGDWSFSVFYTASLLKTYKVEGAQSFVFSTLVAQRETLLRRPVSDNKELLVTQFSEFRKKLKQPTATFMDGDIRSFFEALKRNDEVSLNVD